MGDFRFSLDMKLVGRDGKQHTKSMWLNWWEDIPRRVHDEVVELANECNLPVDDSTGWFVRENDDER